MNKRHIPLAQLEVSETGKKYVLDALNNNRLSYGPYTDKFERSFAKAHDRKFAMVSNSGTSALEVGLHALKEVYGWDDGDEILVPAITFIATSNIVIHNNLKPVFVDVEPDFYCIDPKKIEEKITSKTRAIIPVHLFGQSADMDPIIEIAKKHNLKILEDSCEAMFIKYKGHPVGSQGDISAYSTYIAHIITTGVGGLVTTNDETLAVMMKSLMFHGRDNIYLKIEDDDTSNRLRLSSLIERRFQFNHVGYSYRLTEMEGALGLAEMERKDEIIKTRQDVGQKMFKALKKYDQFFQMPITRPNSENIHMFFPLVVKEESIDKDEFLLFLEENGVETRLFMPLLIQPVYVKLFGDIEHKYPIAKWLNAKGFLLGCHPYLKDEDIEYIEGLFERYLKNVGLLEK